MVGTGTREGAMAETATHDELVARAAALAPQLRARVGEAERLRRLPDANVAAVREAGLFRVLQAPRFGGFGAGLGTHLDAIAALARGCGATAWCAGVVHAHSWLMGLFPEEAQAETYGRDRDTLISAVISPRGTARRVAGGYRLSGDWAFCSGCEHAQFLLLGAAVLDEAGATLDEGDLLVPVGDIAIKDDWHVVGLRGTGSCGIAARDVFVPAHRFLSLRRAIAGDAGREAGPDSGWLPRAAAVPVLALALTPAALGIAEGALDYFTARLPGRVVAYTEGERQIEMPVTQVQAADAATRIATARLVLHRAAGAIEAAARAGAAMPLIERARVRMDCAWAVRLCLDAVEILMLASGGSGIGETNTVQRAWRDLHAINMHGLLNLETNREMYGRIVLGLAPNTPLI
jgi:3-hydroxy-9,10-secoandrosta-1,3,5(10)-triene-9,17-dione monooxygenase